METTDKSILQDFHIDGVQHITPKNAYKTIINGETIMPDVREENEWELVVVANVANR